LLSASALPGVAPHLAPRSPPNSHRGSPGPFRPGRLDGRVGRGARRTPLASTNPALAPLLLLLGLGGAGGPRGGARRRTRKTLQRYCLVPRRHGARVLPQQRESLPAQLCEVGAMARVQPKHQEHRRVFTAVHHAGDLLYDATQGGEPAGEQTIA
jgi:hypothetical protein